MCVRFLSIKANSPNRLLREQTQGEQNEPETAPKQRAFSGFHEPGHCADERSNAQRQVPDSPIEDHGWQQHNREHEGPAHADGNDVAKAVNRWRGTEVEA